MKMINSLTVICVLYLSLNLYSETKYKEFAYEYNIQELIFFKISFVFSDSTYQKTFIKDEYDTVWQCNGNYKFTDSTFIRKNITCQFVKHEDPGMPEKYPNLILKAKNVMNDEFTIFLEENDGEKILTNSGKSISNKWVTFKLVEDEIDE